MSYEQPKKFVAYGTAGFRDDANVLDVILYRVGLLATLRSKYLKGQAIGVMITASHNPPNDNGAKLVDPYGDMLEQSWEGQVSRVANAQNANECLKMIDELYEDLGIDKSTVANVVYGRDTRESGPRLVKALSDGLNAAGAKASNMGIVTTPQLHYLVRAINTAGGSQKNPRGLDSYGIPSQEGYYKKLTFALRAMLSSTQSSDKPITVVVDCANGVGALKLKELIPMLEGLVKVDLVNDDYSKPDLLNMDCGADYVKTNQRLPHGVSPQANVLHASFDGDADRVIFYYTDANGVFHLLDGDKIATLIAGFLQKLISKARTNVNIGVIQTAYANGSSTHYISEKLELPVVCTPTGVKHLHHAAQQFGIGVYFEANGHGTVLFSDDTVKQLKLMCSSCNESDKVVISMLLSFSDLINQAVGDAISDLLAVLAILTVDHLTPSEWYGQYRDLPNRLLKVEVKDRTVFVTTDAERKLVLPEGLQGEIDSMVATIKNGRSFVRASGTEDVVRIYAEAATQELADRLANNVKRLIVEKWGS